MATQAASSPLFYINREDWDCYYGDTSISADGIRVRGGVCAYLDDVDRVWMCEASNSACWTWKQPCAGIAGAVGPGQVACSARGVSWCCIDELEVCTGLENQINVCWAKTFANPLLGVDPANSNATIDAHLVLQDGNIPTVPPPERTREALDFGLASATAQKGESMACAPKAKVDAMINGAREKAIVVGLVIGSIIAIGLLLNATLWLLRIKHRRRVKRKVMESKQDNEDRGRGRRSRSAEFDHGSSRLDLRNASFSPPRSVSASSHCRSAGFDFELEGRNFGIGRGVVHPGKEVLVSSRPLQGRGKSPVQHRIVHPHISTQIDTAPPPPPKPVVPPRLRRLSPSLDSPTLPPPTGHHQRFRNIAEAYDEAVEQPASLDNYASFERGRREASRARAAARHHHQRSVSKQSLIDDQSNPSQHWWLNA